MPEDDKLSQEEINFWNDADNGANINLNLESLNESANTETLFHSLRDFGEKLPREEN